MSEIELSLVFDAFFWKNLLEMTLYLHNKWRTCSICVKKGPIFTIMAVTSITNVTRKFGIKTIENMINYLKSITLEKFGHFVTLTNGDLKLSLHCIEYM